MKVGRIYIIRNTINEKVYIGQTTMSVEERWAVHKKPSTMREKGQYKFYRALKEYGVECFYYEILEDNIPKEMLDEKEISYIEKFNSFLEGYNATKGGDGKLINKHNDVERIVSEYKSGKSAAEIAKDYNVHSVTICRILKSNNIEPRRDGRKLEDYMLNDILELKKDRTYEEIASLYGVDKVTIRRFLKKHGFTRKYTKK